MNVFEDIIPCIYYIGDSIVSIAVMLHDGEDNVTIW